MTCLNCKHWDRDDEKMEGRSLFGFNACNRVRQIENIEDEIPSDIRYNHRHPDYNKTYKEKGETEMAAVCDGSSYYAALLTHPNFSCALFEKVQDK